MPYNEAECKQAKKDNEQCNKDLKKAKEKAADLAKKCQAGTHGVTLADVNAANQETKALEQRLVAIANRTKLYCTK